MQKRAISTIIATVLIVLITVAAVTLLWAGVSPILDKTAVLENPQVRIDVDKSSYTAYNPAADLLSIRVTRGSDDEDITGLKFIIVDDSGNSYSYETDEVVKPNSAKVYKFHLLTPLSSTITDISVAPIYQINGDEIEGTVMGAVKNVRNDNELVYIPSEFKDVTLDDGSGQGATCNNDGTKDSGEACDGTDFGTLTCDDYTGAGSSGSLSCTASCTVDSSACQGVSGPTCGDNNAEGSEVCDGTDLNGQSCISRGYVSGTLSCASNCLSFDESQCVAHYIAALGLENDVVGYWELDGSEDSSNMYGSSLPCEIRDRFGVPGGSITYTSSGKVDQAATFIGGTSNYHIACPTVSIDRSSSLTLSAWVNPDQLTGYQSIAGEGWAGSSFNDDPYTLFIHINGAQAASLVNIVGNSFSFLPSGGGSISGTWKHVALVVDMNAGANGMIYLYLNGVQVNSASIGTSGNILPKTRDFDIGYYLDGDVDEVILFDRALTPTQILGLNNSVN